MGAPLASWQLVLVPIMGIVGIASLAVPIVLWHWHMKDRPQ